MHIRTHLVHRLFLIVMMSAFAGCSLFIGPSMSWKTRNIPKPDGAWTPAISAASQISFSSDRNLALKKIAKNPQLAEPEQKYILAILRKLQGFSSDTSSVLVALAKNPSASMATKNEIAELVSDLSLFSSDKQRVSEALTHPR